MKWIASTSRNVAQNVVGISTLWVGQHQILPCLTREIIHQSHTAKNKPWHQLSALKVYIGGSPAPPTSARAKPLQLLLPWDLHQKNAIMLYWASWSCLNKSLGCDRAAVLEARWAVLPPMPPKFHLSVTSQQAQTPWASLEGADNRIPPVPHRCVFLLKNNRHLRYLETLETTDVTAEDLIFKKFLKISICFANSWRLWNSRDDIQKKKKKHQRKKKEKHPKPNPLK